MTIREYATHAIIHGIYPYGPITEEIAQGIIDNNTIDPPVPAWTAADLCAVWNSIASDDTLPLLSVLVTPGDTRRTLISYSTAGQTLLNSLTGSPLQDAPQLPTFPAAVAYCGERWPDGCDAVPLWLDYPDPVEVDFQGGPGRDHPGAVNYMLARVPTDGDIVELYAEEPYPAPPYPTAEEDPDASSRFDEESYPRLRAEILRQASAEGIPASMLKFWWD